jgi:hypothetical protein
MGYEPILRFYPIVLSKRSIIEIPPFSSTPMPKPRVGMPPVRMPTQAWAWHPAQQILITGKTLPMVWG